ncbi:glycosyltransferase [Marinimicrobium locisalis]|uniref:glycosyltransferase n=1 Tax=Marinimicrobium locisalis TaxID=546022 RepID=UPI003221C65D
MFVKSVTIGMVCPGQTGHMTPALSLSIELRRRGYKVCFFQHVDASERVRELGFECIDYGLDFFPEGRLNEIELKASELEGIQALRYAGQFYSDCIKADLKDLPKLFSELKIDFVIADQANPGAAAVAAVLGLPYITLSAGLPFNQEAGLPPYFTPMKYSKSIFFRAMYAISNYFFNKGAGEALATINNYLVNNRQKPFEKELVGVSKLGQLCQMNKGFDFPRCAAYTEKLYYCGLLHDSALTKDVSFPFQRLNELPLVYCGLGTRQNGIVEKYERIIEAVSGLDVQLVISLGGAKHESLIAKQSEKLIVVEYAPQLELLKRASLFISHCGLGSTMQSLSQGTPILAMPVTNDQPGVAARVRHHKVGRLTYARSPDIIRKEVQTILEDSAYKRGAMTQKDDMARNCGVQYAVDHIESILSEVIRS